MLISSISKVRSFPTRGWLKSIQFFLKQRPNMKFTVHLRDKNGKGEDFEMKGSPP